MLAPDGAVNALLQWLGQAPVPWLRDSSIALAALIIVQFLKSLGYSMVLFLAALQTVPRDLLDAVRVDGANRWQSFRSITLPLIAPFTLMVTILLTIASFKTFALIQLMTRGGPGHATTVLSYYIYQQGSPWAAVVRDGLRQRGRRRTVRRCANPDSAAVAAAAVVGV